jgi:hypothetical protein
LAERFMEMFHWIGANVDTFVAAQNAFDARNKPVP